MKITKDFTTLLDKDLCKHCIAFDVSIYNKNGKIKEKRQYSQSFSLDEIYHDIKRLHPNKTYQLTISIKN